MAIHGAKIAGARAICGSLYEGFAPKALEAMPLVQEEAEGEDPTAP